jgi:ribosomal protein S13
LKVAVINAILGVGSIAAYAFMAKHFIGIQKRLTQMENKQVDTEIRIDLLEYNHLHEDDNLRVF